MGKISYAEYLELLMAEDVTEQSIMQFSVIRKGETAFDMKIAPDPEKVEIPPHLEDSESLMSFANDISRSIQHNRFMRRYKKRNRPPLIVSEGDSWFQFPLIIDDVIDHLDNDYLIYSVGAAGDTAENMIFGKRRKKKSEYFQALIRFKKDVQAFLISAAGNDIIGEDVNTGQSALHDILRPFNGNTKDVLGHIDFTTLNDRLDFLRGAYQTVFDTIRSESGFEDLPILIHGYDYVFPYPWGDAKKKDPRKPKHAAKNEWLGEPLDARKIMDQELRRNILIHLIDQLYAMFGSLASDPQNNGIHIVDCRGALPSVDMWADEIHGTSDGFRAVAARFNDTLRRAIN